VIPTVPLFIVALTVSAYWFCVFVMVGRSWVKFRGPAGAIPKTSAERWMWLIWVPNTAAWVALPWVAWDASRDSLAPLSTNPAQLAWSGLSWLAAIVAVLAFAMTSRCWLAMGSNWTMAVNPKKPTRLVTEGPFSLVRHPIYALSLLLMLCTMLIVATLPMLLVGLIHVAMLVGKASSEERYLLRVHGEAYADYCRRTSRFLPCRWPAAS